MTQMVSILLMLTKVNNIKYYKIVIIGVYLLSNYY